MTIIPKGVYVDVWMAGTNLTGAEWTIVPKAIPATDGSFWSYLIDYGGLGTPSEDGGGGYAGFQTRLDSVPGTPKGVIWSIEGALDYHVGTASGVVAVSTAPEWPDGHSLRMPLDYQVDEHYRFEIARLSSGQVTALGENPATGTWYELTVTHVGGLSYNIGALCVPAGWNGITGYGYSFLERYAGPLDTCEDTEFSAFEFRDITANAGNVPVDHSSAHYSALGDCPALYTDLGSNDWLLEQGPTVGTGATPAAPVLTVGTITSSSVRVTWPDPDPGDAPILGWRLYYAAGVGATTYVGTIPASANGYSFSGLAPSTAYTFEVEAYNVYGTGARGDATATTLATPVVPTTPGPGATPPDATHDTDTKPAPWNVPLTISYVTPVDAENYTTTVLAGTYARNVQIKYQGDYTVSFKMAATNPQAALFDPDKLNRVRVSLTIEGRTVDLFDANVRKRRRTVISPQNEVGQEWQFDSYEVGRDWAQRRALVYPAGGMYEPTADAATGRGTAALTRVSTKPFGPDRTWGWADPTMSVTSWPTVAAANGLRYQQANPLPFPLGRSGAPFGWIDNESWWIWGQPLTNTMGLFSDPEGPCYFHKTFTTDREMTLIIESAGDDYYEVYLNDQLIVSRDKKPDLSTWQRLARTEVKVGPGNNTIRARCFNYDPQIPGQPANTQNIGGFILTVWNQDDPNTPLCRTDGSWQVLAYPTDIGQTPGEILINAAEESFARPGATEFTPTPRPTFSFTKTHDSNGTAWPLIPLYVTKHGSTYQELVDQLAGTYIEYEWRSGGALGLHSTLDAYVAPNIPIPGGGVSPATTATYATGGLVSGELGNCLELTIDEDYSKLCNALLVLWNIDLSEWAMWSPTGTHAGDQDPALQESLRKYGRHEQFLSISQQVDSNAAALTASQNVSGLLGRIPTVTARFSNGLGRFRHDVPFLDYGMFNMIPVANIDDPANATDDVRLTGLTITEDPKTGVIDAVPAFATRVEVWQEMVNRWLSRAALGQQQGATDVGSTSSPSIVKTEEIPQASQTFSGKNSAVGSVATPWEPSSKILVTQGLAKSDGDTGATGVTKIALTKFGTIVAPTRDVSLEPYPALDGFVQWNGPFKLAVAPGEKLNIVVTQDGGHTNISLDVFYTPYPFKV